MVKGTKRLNGVEFATVWENASSAEEVAGKTGMTLQSVIARGTALRSAGVPLKHFPRKNKPQDIGAINKALAVVRGVDQTVIDAEGQKLIQAAKVRREAKANASTADVEAAGSPS